MERVCDANFRDADAVAMITHHDTRWLQNMLKEHGITQESGVVGPYDQRGNEYVVVTTDGPRVGFYEDRIDVAAPTLSEAMHRYWQSLQAYLGIRRHVIWRVSPEAIALKCDGVPAYRIYSRLTAYRSRRATRCD